MERTFRKLISFSILLFVTTIGTIGFANEKEPPTLESLDEKITVIHDGLGYALYKIWRIQVGEAWQFIKEEPDDKFQLRVLLQSLAKTKEVIETLKITLSMRQQIQSEFDNLNEQLPKNYRLQ